MFATGAVFYMDEHVRDYIRDASKVRFDEQIVGVRDDCLRSVGDSVEHDFALKERETGGSFTRKG